MRYIILLSLVSCLESEPVKYHGACYGYGQKEGIRYRECDEHTADGECIFCDGPDNCWIVDSSVVTMDNPGACILGDGLIKQGIDPAELRKRFFGRAL